MSAMQESSEAAILNRVFRPDMGDWPPEAAEALLEIRFGPQDRRRMTRLLRKAKSGTLTTVETETLDNYRHIGRLLELMKARARRSLKLKRAA
jgi:hypothetical protein